LRERVRDREDGVAETDREGRNRPGPGVVPEQGQRSDAAQEAGPAGERREELTRPIELLVQQFERAFLQER
jgi:hypothetical protein